jgi:hypothetical protein
MTDASSQWLSTEENTSGAKKPQTIRNGVQSEESSIEEEPKWHSQN